MEKQRVCKICSKRFSNGKAMGGHMRSHLAKLPVPPKPKPNPTPPPFISRPSPSSSSSFNLNHTKKLLFNNVHPHRSSTSDYSPAAHSDLSVQDRESETDSHPKNPTRKRSKRCRDRADDDDDQTEPVSSVTEAFSTEDVALCLLMMSRDRRVKVEAKKENDFAYDSEGDDDDDDNWDSDSDSLICRHETKHGSRSRSRGKFKCKTCNKMFRSYQALGGHKASHKKINNNGLTDHQMYENGNKLGVVHRRVFKCPFCPREFESGQALGGHKKIHFSHLGNVKNISPPAKFCKISIDLNRPAPGYDDDDEDVVSTVSNATKLILTHHR